MGYRAMVVGIMLTWVWLLIFWLSLLALFYTYVGYPLCAALLAQIRRQPPVDKQTFYPSVTILIAAYNEEECIAATLENKLALDYPQDKLEIIVISDESDDQTDSIVWSFADRGVMLLRQFPRAGKTAALNLAIPLAQGRILVFSDANSIYAKDALLHLVANFTDQSIGYVTGKMIYTNPDGTTIGDGCSAYMKYENWLRKIETDLGSIVGVDGGIDGMRKDLYVPLDADQLPDFVQPLKIIEQGYRVVYEQKALLKEASLQDSRDEYRMRVRVSLRAIWALFDMKHLFLPGENLVYSWQIWSHKVLRYICFIFLITTYFSNLFLLTNGPLFKGIFVLQNIAYLAAFLASMLDAQWVNNKLFRFANYFVLLNIASGHAVIKFLLRNKQVIWIPRKG